MSHSAPASTSVLDSFVLMIMFNTSWSNKRFQALPLRPVQTRRTQVHVTLQVDFDTDLDLGPFMSNRRGPAQPYSLYGVLVHSGHSVHSGHYYAFVKAPNGLWHQLDDNHVSQVSTAVCQELSSCYASSGCVAGYMLEVIQAQGGCMHLPAITAVCSVKHHVS